jgi:hypothetical protein
MSGENRLPSASEEKNKRNRIREQEIEHETRDNSPQVVAIYKCILELVRTDDLTVHFPRPQ